MKLHLPKVLLATLFVASSVVHAEAVKLEGQSYSSSVEDYGMPGFSNLQFKSNEDYRSPWDPDAPGYDATSPNLLDDANCFSAVFQLKDFAIKPGHYFGGPDDNVYLEFFGVGFDGTPFGVGITAPVDGNRYWAIYQQDNKPSTATGTIAFDGAAGEYIFRSGADFIDLWRVVDGKVECLVSYNQPLKGDYLNGWDGDDNSFLLGDEFSTYLKSNHIESADLYNGLYTAGGLIPETSDNIPEPATATLSLLALAGLAARRRRK